MLIHSEQRRGKGLPQVVVLLGKCASATLGKEEEEESPLSQEEGRVILVISYFEHKVHALTHSALDSHLA